MTGPEPGVPAGYGDRRAEERRVNSRVADLSVPEFRRIALTWLLSAIVVVLFLWMVGEVLIAAILGIVVAAYLRPLYNWFLARTGRPILSAVLTLVVLIVPVLGALAYSYLELVGVLRYIASNQDEVATRIDDAIRRIPFLANVNASETVRRYVLLVSDYGSKIPAAVQETVVELSVAIAIFLFTAAYVFTDADSIVNYVRSKVPKRYDRLREALVTNVRGVLYGAIYSTLLTQSLKTFVIFVMNLVFGVPLAAVLAILSFIIGFFPIVGSWSVYVPIAAWLLVFRDSPVQAGLMILVGFVLNTLFISTYLRPKIAAERSGVLNFYWMFVALVTGVYTFGLAGILLGPILIGLLKAVVDSVTAQTSWRLLEADDGGDG
ncbi:MAG TPA: AI-2E family transporter [Gemmatimonadaceae bacterium]|jgi:predicted PurR-regulated permease PerM|nr:AI-2E family transporter [Gemmatimonadaceae bacterium]